MYKSASSSRQASLFWDMEAKLDSKHPLFILANMGIHQWTASRYHAKQRGKHRTATSTVRDWH